MNLRMMNQMIKIIFWLFILFAGAWIGEQMNDDPGFMILSLAGYRIEMTGWLAIAGLCTTWILVYLLLKFFTNIRLDRRLVSWSQNRSRVTSGNQLQQGLSQLARGNFRVAHKLFSKSATKSNAPTMNFLLAAFAAHAEGKRAECDKWLIKAENIEGADFVLAGLLQAMVQVQRGDNEQALATLNRMPDQNKNPFRQELLRKIYLQLKDWKQLETVITDIKQLKGKSASKLYLAEKELTLHQFSGSAKAELPQKWKALTTELKQDPEILLAYCKHLVAHGSLDLADQVLQKSISQEFNGQLVLEYGLLDGDAAQQLLIAERWLRDKPADPNLLVTLGRISLKNKYWGKAQEYFDLAVDICDHPVAHAELGRYFAAKKDHEQSLYHFEKSMIASHQLPSIPLPEPEQ